MGRRKRRDPKTWTEVFQAQRKAFPPGCCVTKVIPDKRNKKPKHRKGQYDDDH